ncbi:hypothetical protein HY989_05220 [Candidatus Micrarchaeota archaeon]|nr:hypothetical protein [Candidatus Micrarchaeota archaeon]
MEITYLSDIAFGWNFIFALLFLTLIIWLAFKALFGFDSFSHSLLFAVLAWLFLPFIVSATQIGSAFFISVLLGGIAISQTYRWGILQGMLAALVAIMVGLAVIPAI